MIYHLLAFVNKNYNYLYDKSGPGSPKAAYLSFYCSYKILFKMLTASGDATSISDLV